MSSWATPSWMAFLMSEAMKAAHWSLKLGGRRPLQGDLGDFLHFHPEGLEGRFFQEGAGARRAGFVHGVIGGNRVGDVGVLGVLAADFENGVHLGVEIDRGRGVGDDLVDDAVREGVQPRDLPARPAHAQPRDADRFRVHLPPHLLDDRAVALARCAHRVAVRAQVHGGQQGVVGSPQQHRLGGGGAHVEAQDADVSRPEGAAFDGFELHHAGEISERREAVRRCGPRRQKARQAR